jgi:short-subunit dehydrogenase
MSALVVITGASSGLGQALALQYYKAGYNLALLARRDTEIRHWAESNGLQANRYRVYAANVANIDSIVTAGLQCLAEQGVPEVVIANAGISIGIDTAERGDLDVLASIFTTNNVGLAATFHPFVAAMKARGSGRLVGIASVASVRGLPGHGGYCASKAAVVAYCESLRGELRGTGVKVVTICPGYVDTPMTRKNRYPMPFLMPVEEFAKRAFAVIAAGYSYRVIPWQMGVVAMIMRILPDRLFDRLAAGRGRKQRIDDT